MQRSKYPNLNRLIREVQEVTDIPAGQIDGLIGQQTEDALAKALQGFDGSNVLEYLSDLPHHSAVISTSLPNPNQHFTRDEPPWLQVARKYLGLREIKGKKHNPTILDFWKRCKLPFRDDETAWCAGFAGGVLVEAGYTCTWSGMARSYEEYGRRLMEIKPGAILVFWRKFINSPSGHVGFAADFPSDGYVPLLGGNQGDQVCIKRYPLSRLVAIRWPHDAEHKIVEVRKELKYDKEIENILNQIRELAHDRQGSTEDFFREA